MNLIDRLPQPYFETQAITPDVFLRDRANWVLLDVRAPGEFAEGHIPGALSCPVLDDSERHQVGLKYKRCGQQAAIDLGTKLVWEQRGVRAAVWLAEARKIQAQRKISGKIAERILVSCWRGGLRSQLAASWLAEHLAASPGQNVEVLRLTGGYKALRGLLLEKIAAPHRMDVLTGMTGSGKTILLHELLDDPDFESNRVVDLEGMARHRGSSFGHAVGADGQRVAQPSQQTFENELGLLLFDGAKGRLIVEDESTMIGRVSIPDSFRLQMRVAPLVVLESPLRERAEAIYEDYVTRPLDGGCSVDDLWAVLAENIKVLERRLGGKNTADALKFLEDGRALPRAFDRQVNWIELLLEHYYDRAYSRSTKLAERNVVFSGDRRACHEFLRGLK